MSLIILADKASLFLLSGLFFLFDQLGNLTISNFSKSVQLQYKLTCADILKNEKKL